MQRSRVEVVTYIDDFVAGRGGEWDWDDFTSIPISDPELDRIRQLCCSMCDIYPPEEPGHYCSPEGFAELRRIADDLRNGTSNW